MRDSKSLIASVVLLLPAAGVAAEPAAPTDFALEFVMPGQPPPGRAVIVRCLEGCDWAERTIQCPADQRDCRAVIASRRLDTAQTVRERRPKARPLAGSHCLGIQTITNPPGETTQRCEQIDEHSESCYFDEVPAPDSRAFVNDVLPKSPAELAGFSPGDVIVSVNGVSVRGRMDVMKVLASTEAGQAFDVLLERDGAPMTVQGQLGIGMSDGACAIADARLLETATEYDPTLEFGSFKLEFDLPGVEVELRCLDGCGGGRGGNLCGFSIDGPAEKCTIQVYQAVGGDWTVGSREFVDSQLRQSKQE